MKNVYPIFLCMQFSGPFHKQLYSNFLFLAYFYPCLFVDRFSSVCLLLLYRIYSICRRRPPQKPNSIRFIMHLLNDKYRYLAEGMCKLLAVKFLLYVDSLFSLFLAENLHLYIFFWLFAHWNITDME